MNFSKLDPNVVALIVSVLGGLWTWISHKANGEKTSTWREILDDVVRQVINAADVDLDNVKARLETKLQDAVTKIGLRGPTANSLVHEFVEYGSAELHERFATIQRQLDKISAEAQATLKVLRPAATPGTP